MRFYPRTDSSQKAIIQAAREFGASVAILAHLGGGIPDLLIGFMGVNGLFEVKAKGGKLTPAESDFYQDWQGQVTILRSIDDLLAWRDSVLRLNLEPSQSNKS